MRRHVEGVFTYQTTERMSAARSVVPSVRWGPRQRSQQDVLDAAVDFRNRRDANCEYPKYKDSGLLRPAGLILNQSTFKT